MAEIKKGKWDLAEPALREALRLNSKSAEAWNNLGVILAAKEDFVGALDAHRRAIELRPDWPTARFALGKTLVASGRRSEGLQEMATACRIAPQQLWRRQMENVSMDEARKTVEPPTKESEAAKAVDDQGGRN